MRTSFSAVAAGILVAGFALVLRAQEPHPAPGGEVPLQPVAQQVRRIQMALGYLGQPLPSADHIAINEAVAIGNDAAGVARLQQILDRHVLATVHINPESRVKVEQGAARPELVQGGTRLFLIKVINQARVTAALTLRSPNTGRVYIPSRGTPQAKQELGPEQVRERWAEIILYDKAPMRPRLSGLGIEYVILQVYSRDAGQRSASISFNVGQGTQDIGFRNDVDILFTAAAAHAVRLRVNDEDGQPTTAGFLIRDQLDRIYPNISKRLAPDFFFQPQVYRADGDTIHLPPGTFTLTVSRGPEYVSQTENVTIAGPRELFFRLARWINPSRYGYYSGDHHITPPAARTTTIQPKA